MYSIEAAGLAAEEQQVSAAPQKSKMPLSFAVKACFSMAKV